MDLPSCLPRGWLGNERFPVAPECSCGLTGAPFEFHGPDCDRVSRPHVDEETLALVDHAVESLAFLRGSVSSDAGAALSCLASLIAEAQGRLPDAVAAARDQDYTWPEIAARLATTTCTARRRYSGYASWVDQLARERGLRVVGGEQFVVARVGSLEDTRDAWEPYRLVAPDGTTVEAVTAFLADLHAAGRSVATLRSYGMDLLRWFRFLWAVGVAWDRASRIEARDFCRWLQVGGKPTRPHWRRRDDPGTGPTRAVTGEVYAASVRAHSETVLRSFYEFHREAGTGPILNPFPLDRSRRDRRAHGHHNPMEPHANERVGLYRPRVPTRIPRAIPDDQFNEIFARLRSHRDRALVAFYVSTGARASELLSVTQSGVDPGRQVVSVVRKGSRAVQELPASTDSFVWLRLYQVEMEGLVPRGHRQPLWWTLRRPFRPLTYHAVHRMFERVNDHAGASATLHALRHTAAYRMAEDPALPLTDVQYVLGHAHLTTTQIYLTPRKEDVIRRVLAHHGEQRRQAAERRSPPPAPGYRPEALEVLFGTTAR